MGRFWTCDPIDGTKGFVRGDQYAVCLALLDGGRPVVAVVGCPNLMLDPNNPASEKGALFVAVKGGGAFMVKFAPSLSRRFWLMLTFGALAWPPAPLVRPLSV